MHLKKLSLRGFKTFADETALEFGPGVTAIVGPNGSGKSNIVDALLWAMGERSAKTLRGHSATDVIFNGSSDRRALGMAEVSLTFDNESGSLSLPHPEVQVSRRVFRDGDSDYAINGKDCRLKDVFELFLDTGLGPEAYSVVSQREIDSILSARPEERRALIEGAAGVQKYRARRGETRRKLERVEADLTRVEDIVHELSNQLGPLEEAAELARQYEGMAVRLRALQLGVLARDHQSRSERLTKLRETFETNAKTAQAAETEIARLETSERELDGVRRQLEGVLDELRTEITEVVSRLKGAEGEIAVARERRRALSEQQEFQAGEIGLLRARITSLKTTLSESRGELERAQRSGAALSDEAARAEHQLSDASARLTEATRALQTRQARVVELIRAGQTRREAAAAGRASREALHGRLRDLETLRTNLEREEAGAAHALETARIELQAARERAAALQTKAGEAREAIDAARRGAQTRADELNALREKRSASNSRARALRELEASLDGVQGGARAVVQAINRGSLSANYTLVADALRAPQGLETALEIALGAGVHNLICPTDADAKTAIDWLKRERAGRATFLPLPSLRPSGLSDRTRALTRERGVVGIASELVEASREFRVAVEYLLGRVLVVETLEQAVQLAKRCEGGARLVTLEGDLVLPAGAITGGQGKAKAGGLLARKRELDDLERELDGYEDRIVRAETGQREAREAVTRAESAQRAAGETANEARSQVARVEREVEHAERETRRVKVNLEAAGGQLAALRHKMAGGEEQHQTHEREAAELEQQAREAETSVEEASQLAAQRTAERETVAVSVAEVRAGYGATQERLNALRRAVTESEKSIREAEAGVTSREANIARASESDAVLVTREAELVARLSELGARQTDLEARFAKGREERTTALKGLEEASASLRVLRVRGREAEDERNRAEVRLASTEAELAEIVRRFTEEFELSIEDALNFGNQIAERKAAQDEIEMLKGKVSRLGTVNLGAIEQFEQVKERLEFLQTQKADLENAKAGLDAVITEVDGRTREQFLKAFKEVSEAFAHMFERVFDGGSTYLALTQPDNVLETGIDLRVQLPGKSKQDISLLSGGERALTALAFMLALLRVNPSPFVVLDEVDAPLDQSNVNRFADLLREFTDRTQFIVITHNSGTMQAADVLYGVTMQRPGVSTLMSVRLVDAQGEELAHNGTTNGHVNGHANGAQNGASNATPDAAEVVV